MFSDVKKLCVFSLNLSLCSPKSSESLAISISFCLNSRVFSLISSCAFFNSRFFFFSRRLFSFPCQVLLSSKSTATIPQRRRENSQQHFILCKRISELCQCPQKFLIFPLPFKGFSGAH